MRDQRPGFDQIRQQAGSCLTQGLQLRHGERQIDGGDPADDARSGKAASRVVADDAHFTLRYIDQFTGSCAKTQRPDRHFLNDAFDLVAGAKDGDVIAHAEAIFEDVAETVEQIANVVSGRKAEGIGQNGRNDGQIGKAEELAESQDRGRHVGRQADEPGDEGSDGFAAALKL